MDRGFLHSKQPLRIAAVLVVLIVAGAAGATVWHVPADFATIQPALNAADDGDTVLVAPGTYTGTGNRDLDLLGKDLRVIGEDGSTSFVPVNVQPGDPAGVLQQMKTQHFTKVLDATNQILNNVTVGKYDVVVSVGPSYSTQRQEAAESMIRFVQAVPSAAAAMGDLVASKMDWPGADQIAKRLRKTVPPQLLDPEEIEEAGIQVPDGPDPATQMMQMKLQLEAQKAQVEQQRLVLDAAKADTERVKAFSQAILNLARAEGEEAGQQLAQLTAAARALQQTGTVQRTEPTPRQPTPQGAPAPPLAPEGVPY